MCNCFPALFRRVLTTHLHTYIHVWAICIGYFAFYTWCYRLCSSVLLLFPSPTFDPFQSICWHCESNSIRRHFAICLVFLFHQNKCTTVCVGVCFAPIFFSLVFSILWLPITTCSSPTDLNLSSKMDIKEGLLSFNMSKNTDEHTLMYLCICILLHACRRLHVRAYFHVKYLFWFLLDFVSWRNVRYHVQIVLAYWHQIQTSKTKFDRICLRMRI